FGRTARKVDNATMGVGATVVDADYERTAVPGVGHAGVARQRHRRMRRRQVRHVVDFAIGGETAVEGIAVPGGKAFLPVARLFLGMIPLALDLVGLANLIAAAAARQAGAQMTDAR